MRGCQILNVALTATLIFVCVGQRTSSIVHANAPDMPDDFTNMSKTHFQFAREPCVCVCARAENRVIPREMAVEVVRDCSRHAENLVRTVANVEVQRLFGCEFFIACWICLCLICSELRSIAQTQIEPTGSTDGRRVYIVCLGYQHIRNIFSAHMISVCVCVSQRACGYFWQCRRQQ